MIYRLILSGRDAMMYYLLYFVLLNMFGIWHVKKLKFVVLEMYYVVLILLLWRCFRYNMSTKNKVLNIIKNKIQSTKHHNKNTIKVVNINIQNKNKNKKSSYSLQVQAFLLWPTPLHLPHFRWITIFSPWKEHRLTSSPCLLFFSQPACFFSTGTTTVIFFISFGTFHCSSFPTRYMDSLYTSIHVSFK